MKKMKLITLILVVAMILAIGVGCQSTEDNKQGQQTPAPTPNPTPAPTPTPTPTPTPGAELKDGNYEAEGERDDRGWMPTIKITVADGKITEVNYDEMNEEKQLKSENEEYNNSWKGAAGISAPEAYPKLEADLIEKQDVDKVDTVAGATQATKDFKAVAKKALGQE